MKVKSNEVHFLDTSKPLATLPLWNMIVAKPSSGYEGKMMIRKSRYVWISLFVLFTWLLLGCNQAKDVRESAEKEATVATHTTNQQVSIKPMSDQQLALLPQEIQRIKEKGKLVVAMFWEDRPPFFYRNDKGEFVGIDVMLAKDIAKSLDVQIEFDRSAKTFDEVVDLVVMGKADIAISKLSITLSRALRVNYTDPYVVFHQSLLVNRLALSTLESEHPGQDILQQIILTNQKIGVRATTSYVEHAKNLFPNAQIVTFEKMEDLIQSVREGDILAAFYDENELKTYINQSPELSVYAKLFILQDRMDPIAIAVSHQNRALLNWLNIYLELRKDTLGVDNILLDYRGGS